MSASPGSQQAMANVETSPQTSKPTKRVSRACDHCRRLKEKCEGGIPCRRCIHSRRICEFKTTPYQARDTRFSRSLRATDGNPQELLVRSAYMERILKHTIRGISLDTDSLRCLAESISNEETNHETVDTSSQEPDDLAMEKEVCTIDPVEDTTTHFSGEFSYWNFSMKIKRLIDDSTAHSHDPARLEAERVPSYWRAGQLNSVSESIRAAVSCCPPRPIADFLVDVFFKYAEGHLFYIDKSWLLERVDVLYKDARCVSSKDSGTISIILAVLAVGTQYAYMDSSARKDSGISSPNFSEDEIGSMFYQHAIRLLPEIIETSSLESCQACLLFGLYALPIDASGLAYIYINLASRLATQNGMHRKYTGTALSSAMIETRNRVWWTTYTLEKKISLFHGRPLSTQRGDVDADLPRIRADLQTDNFSPKVSYMLASIQLSQKHEECFATISLLRRSRKQDMPQVMTELLGMKRGLETWWLSLQTELYKDSDISDQQSRTALQLRLEYCLVRMFIGRPFLLKKSSSQQAGDSPSYDDTKIPSDGSLSVVGSQRSGSRSAELIEDCLQAAKMSLETCQTIRDSGSGLARASYTEYSSCRASLLVLIAHSIQTRSDQLRKLLQEGLSMIQYMSAAGDSARSEVLLIEALERALTRLHTFNRNDTRSNSTAGTSSSGYDSFKNWESMWKTGASNNLLRPAASSDSRERPSMAFTAPSSRTNSQMAKDFPVYEFARDGGSSNASQPARASRTFQPDMRLSFLDQDSLTGSSGWAGIAETQVLEEFLAMPQHMFDSEAGMFENSYGAHGM